MDLTWACSQCSSPGLAAGWEGAPGSLCPTVCLSCPAATPLSARLCARGCLGSCVRVLEAQSRLLQSSPGWAGSVGEQAAAAGVMSIPPLSSYAMER